MGSRIIIENAWHMMPLCCFCPSSYKVHSDMEYSVRDNTVFAAAPYYPTPQIPPHSPREHRKHHHLQFQKKGNLWVIWNALQFQMCWRNMTKLSTLANVTRYRYFKRLSTHFSSIIAYIWTYYTTWLMAFVSWRPRNTFVVCTATSPLFNMKTTLSGIKLQF